MRLLLDSCVWAGAAADLSATDHDVETVASWPEDPGDEEILDVARKQDRILVTLDKDFGELAIVKGFDHAGIVRLAGFGARQQGAICIRLLRDYSKELEDGAIVTAQPGRVRIRPKTP
ncbi:MAG: toxin-antitoxin system, toxin component, PIN family protein [Proteobacteria bacterium]|nr:toxin-antitoxin system, toxin component, PIN family protein [Pseudomonadota bacterium]